jgi:hypothetical protein
MLLIFFIRLATILERKSLAPRKLDEIKIKANILDAFAGGKAMVDAASEHIKVEL